MISGTVQADLGILVSFTVNEQSHKYMYMYIQIIQYIYVHVCRSYQLAGENLKLDLKEEAKQGTVLFCAKLRV